MVLELSISRSRETKYSPERWFFWFAFQSILAMKFLFGSRCPLKPKLYKPPPPLGSCVLENTRIHQIGAQLLLRSEQRRIDNSPVRTKGGGRN